MYLICGLFCFALYSFTRELALLMWAQSLALRGLYMGIQSVLLQGSSGRAHIQVPLHCPPVLNLFKRKVKVTPFTFASYSSNLFLVLRPAFSIWGTLFIWLQPKASMTEPMAHIACFAHLGNVSKTVSIFKWPLISYLYENPFKVFSIDGKMYPHCKLFYKKMCATSIV